MKARAATLLCSTVVAVVFTAGCGSGGANPSCEWHPDDDPIPLDLRAAGNERHLAAEALAAEDRAIRCADRLRGHHSGNFAGTDVYVQTRERCMATLFDALAAHHSVTVHEVRQALSYRPVAIDLVVLLLFTLVYAAAANSVARWLLDRVPPDSTWLRSLFAGAAGCATSAAGLGVFGLYAGTIEMIRTGATHLSYRAARPPWTGHQFDLFAGGVAVFVAIAASRESLAIFRASHGGLPFGLEGHRE